MIFILPTTSIYNASGNEVHANTWYKQQNVICLLLFCMLIVLAQLSCSGRRNIKMYMKNVVLSIYVGR